MFDVNEQDVNSTVDELLIRNPPPIPPVFDVNEQKITATVDDEIDIPPPLSP